MLGLGVLVCFCVGFAVGGCRVQPGKSRSPGLHAPQTAQGGNSQGLMAGHISSTLPIAFI